MKSLLILVFLTWTIASIHAQGWQRTYDLIPETHPSNSDMGQSILYNNGLYYLTTGTLAHHNTFGCFGVYALKPNGDVQYKSPYLFSFESRAGGTHALMRDGSSVLVTGDVWTGNDFSYFLMKMQENTDSMWMKIYGGGFMNFGRSLVRTSSGDYIIHGDGGGFCGTKTCVDIVLLRTDPDGNEKWRKTLGLTDTLRQSSYGNMVSLPNDDLAIVFEANLYGSNVGYTYVVMLDSLANIKWIKQFYRQQASNPIIQALPDGNLLFSACVDTLISPWFNPFVTFLTKIDPDGNIIYTNYFPSDYIRIPSNFISASDGSIMLCGVARNSSFDYDAGWLSKISATGDIEWERVFSTDNLKFPLFWFTDIEEVDDGFVMSGCMSDTLAGGEWNGNAWVVKVDKNGCYSPDLCDDYNVILKSNDLFPGSRDIRVYPNPSPGLVELVLPEAIPEVQLQVYDQGGKLVKNRGGVRNGDSIHLEMPGVYFFVFVVDRQVLSLEKVLIKN